MWQNGGGGGRVGGGGSPEDKKNVQFRELDQQFVVNGVRIKFEFIQKATSVGYVEFDAKKSVGKTTTIIEELKGRSTLTPTEPEGEVYRYLNIWIGSGGFANPDNIGNAVAGFRVSKTWISENGVIVDSITLQYFDEDWNSLQTVKVSEDDEYIYFEAETPGFSPFAITANSEKIVIEAESEEEEELQAPTGTEHRKRKARSS